MSRRNFKWTDEADSVLADGINNGLSIMKIKKLLLLPNGTPTKRAVMTRITDGGYSIKKGKIIYRGENFVKRRVRKLSSNITQAIETAVLAKEATIDNKVVEPVVIDAPRASDEPIVVEAHRAADDAAWNDKPLTAHEQRMLDKEINYIETLVAFQNTVSTDCFHHVLGKEFREVHTLNLNNKKLVTSTFKEFALKCLEKNILK